MAIFPWSLSVLAMVIAAMVIFREPIGELISRSHEWKAGSFFSLKAKQSAIDPKVMAAIRDMQKSAAAGAEEADLQRLVIRDSNGKVRILVGTTPSGQPFFSMFDEDGEPRASLVGSSAEDPDQLTMIMLRGKGKKPDDMACLIGAERDGTGTIGVRERSGAWREMS